MIVKEKQLIEVNIGKETYLVPEGLWAKLKNFVARAGSIEKGGEIFGRSEKTQAAQKQIQNVLGKQSNQMIKDLDAALKQIKQKGEKLGWPNNTEEFTFRDGAAEIAVVYNSIVNHKEMDAVAKNALIDDLRIYVKKVIDYDLADVYKHMNESQKQELLDELFGFGKSKTQKAIDAVDAMSDEEARTAATGEKPSKSSGGPISAKGNDTAVGKGLESNLLPGLLAAGGVGALLASSPWFQELLTTTDVTQEPDKIVKIVNDTVVGDAQKGDGLTQMLGRLTKGDPAAFTGDTKAVDFFKDIDKLGITPDNPAGLADMADNSGDFSKSWGAIKGAMEANPDATLTDLFVADGKVNPAFFIKKGAPLVQKAITSVVKKGATTAVKGGAGATLGKLAAATGLANMGIPLVAGGALVKFLRKKGLDQSRFQVLNQVLTSLKPVPAETPAEKKVDQVVNEPEEKAAKEYGAGETIHIYKPGGEDNDSLQRILGPQGLNIPRWALDRVLKRVKDELEANNFNVLEEEISSLDRGNKTRFQRAAAQEKEESDRKAELRQQQKDREKADFKKSMADLDRDDGLDGEFMPQTKTKKDPKIPKFGDPKPEAPKPSPEQSYADLLKTFSKKSKKQSSKPVDDFDIDTASAPGYFSISGISDILQGVGTDLDDPAVNPKTAVRPKQRRAIQKAISNYLRDKLKKADVLMREELLMAIADEILLEYEDRHNKFVNESNRFKKLAGIIKG
jgi:hypothetical protein